MESLNNHREPAKLLRSHKDRVFAGICGGLGEYFIVDPVLMRLVWLLVVVFTGVVPGVVIYLLSILIIPAEKKEEIITNK